MEARSDRTRAGVLQLAGPLIISFWFRALFQWVDTAYASMLEGIGDESIAAIGLTMPFDFLMIACWVGTSNGLTARLSAAMGARQGAKIAQLQRATVRIVFGLLLLFLAVALGLWLFGGRLAPDEVTARQFRTYATVLVGGFACTAFWAILPDSIVKAHQDTRSTMWAGLISTAVNVLLNTLFVFAFGWGIFGIALATVLGRLGGLSYALRQSGRHERRRRALDEDTDASVFERPVRAILSLSVPAGLSFLLMAVEGLAINAMLAGSAFGKELLASWSIFDRAVRFLSMPLIATGVALLPLCAALWGERDFARIRRELKTALLAGVAYSVVLVGPIAWLLGPWLAAGLADAERTRADATIALRYVPLAVLAMGPMFQIRSTFEGLQQPRPGLITAALRAFVLVVPLVWLGLRHGPALGLDPIAGACIGYALGAGIAASVLGWWIRRALGGGAGLRAPGP